MTLQEAQNRTRQQIKKRPLTEQERNEVVPADKISLDEFPDITLGELWDAIPDDVLFRLNKCTGYGTSLAYLLRTVYYYRQSMKAEPVQQKAWAKTEVETPASGRLVLCVNRKWGILVERSWERHTDQDKEWFVKTFSHWTPPPAKPIEHVTPEQPLLSLQQESKGIYIASKTIHAESWKSLRDDAEVDVISSWIDEAGPGESIDLADLSRRCIKESTTCKAMIVFSLKEEYLKGALIEMGAALAAGKTVYLAGPVLPEGSAFTKHPNVIQCEGISDAVFKITGEQIVSDDRGEQPSPSLPEIEQDAKMWCYSEDNGGPRCNPLCDLCVNPQQKDSPNDEEVIKTLIEANTSLQQEIAKSESERQADAECIASLEKEIADLRSNAFDDATELRNALEDKDLFALSFLVFALTDPRAQALLQAHSPTGAILALYKDRPFLQDASQQ